MYVSVFVLIVAAVGVLVCLGLAVTIGVVYFAQTKGKN